MISRIKRLPYGALILFALAAGCDKVETPSRSVAVSASSIPVRTYEVVATFPHDPDAFTQGLQYHNGILLESTGRYGQSSLRHVDKASGRVIRRVNLPDRYFGEGIAIVGDEVMMLTWREGTGFVFDRDSLRLLRQFSYDGEGWGLAFDGRHVVMSDGSYRLTFRDPATFSVERVVEVTAEGHAVPYLNELAWVRGQIWANILMSDRIACINPITARWRRGSI